MRRKNGGTEFSSAAWLGRVGSSEKTRCNATGRVELEAVGETVMMREEGASGGQLKLVRERLDLKGW